MGQTNLLSREDVLNYELPFVIINKKPQLSIDEEMKNRKNVEKELYDVFKKYCKY